MTVQWRQPLPEFQHNTTCEKPWLHSLAISIQKLFVRIIPSSSPRRRKACLTVMLVQCSQIFFYYYVTLYSTQTLSKKTFTLYCATRWGYQRHSHWMSTSHGQFHSIILPYLGPFLHEWFVVALHTRRSDSIHPNDHSVCEYIPRNFIRSKASQRFQKCSEADDACAKLGSLVDPSTLTICTWLVWRNSWCYVK